MLLVTSILLLMNILFNTKIFPTYGIYLQPNVWPTQDDPAMVLVSYYVLLLHMLPTSSLFSHTLIVKSLPEATVHLGG